MDEKEIDYDLLVYCCMNILVYQRNMSEFQDLEEITEIMEVIFYQFLSKAGNGQGVYLDDIEVMQLKPLNLIGNKATCQPKELQMYDIFGRKRFSRSKGLNIIKESDGTVRKMFVR